jgi:hypothetical protein
MYGSNFSALKWLHITAGFPDEPVGEDGVSLVLLDSLFTKVFSLMQLERFEFRADGSKVS